VPVLTLKSLGLPIGKPNGDIVTPRRDQLLLFAVELFDFLSPSQLDNGK